MDDVYGRLYGLMRDAGGDGRTGAAARLRLGRVIGAEPLRVDVGGTTQESGRFWLPDRLTPKRALEAGDLVLMATEDDQTFYLLDKVVRA